MQGNVKNKWDNLEVFCELSVTMQDDTVINQSIIIVNCKLFESEMYLVSVDCSFTCYRHSASSSVFPCWWYPHPAAEAENA